MSRARRGNTSRCTLCVSPAASVTVRWMRYHTLAEVSPVVGTTKLPLVTPLVVGRKGCECVSWWKSTRQLKALAGKVVGVPSGSVPVPAMATVMPPV